MSEWSEYYVTRMTSGYMDYCRDKYRPFIKAVLQKATGNVYPVFREEGCGIATFSKIVALERSRHCYIYAFDNDLAQCVNAVANTNNLDISISVYCADILKSQPQDLEADIIFSHGVLEHFDYNDIKKILSRQRKEAKHVIHYVPTDGYEEPSFGDERLLPVEWWVINFKPTEYIVFNDGKDLVLIWE